MLTPAQADQALAKETLPKEIEEEIDRRLLESMRANPQGDVHTVDLSSREDVKEHTLNLAKQAYEQRRDNEDWWKVTVHSDWNPDKTATLTFTRVRT